MMLLLLSEVYKTELKYLLFSANEVADVCSTSVVKLYLLAVEKSLLALLAYLHCTDGVLYCLPYLFDVSEDLVCM